MHSAKNRRPLRAARFLLPVMTGAMLGAALAQAPPPGQDPAQIQRQREELERQRLQRPSPDTAPRLSAPPTTKVSTPDSTASFMLRSVEAGTSQLLTPAELDLAIAPQLGKPTTFADVQALVQRINALYYERGHLTARALVPAQKIQDGVLKVQLVEATLARIALPESTRLSPVFVRGVIATREGELIQVPQIGEQLQRMHRGSDNRLALSFVPAEGDAVGQSVIKVEIEEPPQWTGRLSLSNEGNASVGRNQLSFAGALNNWLGYADKLALLGIYSEGASSLSLNYSGVLGASLARFGTRGSVGLSAGNTKTVSGPQNDLIVDGGSSAVTLGLSQPLLFRGAWTLEAGASLGESRSNTTIAGERFSDVRMGSLAASLSLGYQTEVASLGSTLNLSRVHTRAANIAARDSTVGQLSFNAYRQLFDAWSLQAHGTAQFTSAVNLPAALQLQLGGPGSVRGFASPSASGDRGETVTLELHRQFAAGDLGSIDGFVFIDHGRVRIEGTPATELSSAGLGLNWRRGIWNLSASLASPRKTDSVPAAKTEFYLRVSADLDAWFNRRNQRSPP